MKYLFIIIVMSSCCKKEVVTYCNVQNPVTDISWIAHIDRINKTYGYGLDSVFIQKMSMPDTGLVGFSEYQYNHKSKKWYQSYLTCEGTYICSEQGGITGASDCFGKKEKKIIGDTIFKSF